MDCILKDARTLRDIFKDLYNLYIFELSQKDTSLFGVSYLDLANQNLENKNDNPFIILIDDVPIGFVVFSKEKDQSKLCASYISELFIKKVHRKQGIAKDIFLSYLKNEEKDVGFYTLKNSHEERYFLRILKEDNYEYEIFDENKERHLIHILVRSKNRFNRYYEIERKKVKQIFTSLDMNIVLEDYSLIKEGIRTTNYKVGTNDGDFLLKIFIDKEGNNGINVLSYLDRIGFTPKVFKFDKKKEIFPYNYAILEFIEGEDLNSFIDKEETIALDIVEEIGHKLALIHNLSYENTPFKLTPCSVKKDIIDYLNDKAGNNLRKGLKESIIKYIENNDDVFKEIDKNISFCHGDFSLFNILVSKEKRKVYFIDFEFCKAASVFIDIGRFFRNENVKATLLMTKEVMETFKDSYNHTARHKLLDNWYHLANLADIPNLLSMINIDGPNEELLSDVEKQIVSLLDLI